MPLIYHLEKIANWVIGSLYATDPHLLREPETAIEMVRS